jgi:hypothetical protein
MAGAGRRQLLKTVGALAAAALSPPLAAAPRRLDLDKPQDNLLAWMKLRASAETQDVYFWFTGGLDLAMAGEPIAPIVTVESLILRRTVRLAADLYQVTDYEATLYRDPVTGELAEELINPITGRSVRPLHYTEGPVPFEFAAGRPPRLVGMENPFPEAEAPFLFPWHRVGDDLWMTKSAYFHDRPHWLDIGDWPLEAPAENLNVATVTTLKARWSDVLDAARPSVPTEMFFQATSGWLPWMLMGQRPGYVIWHEAGKKLFSLDEAPPATLAAIERVHPQWFRRPVPWEGFTNLFLQYKAQRRPAR